MGTKKNAVTKVPCDWGIYSDLDGFFARLREKVSREADGQGYWEDRTIKSGDIRDVMRTYLHFGIPAENAKERMGVELGMQDGELEQQLVILLETLAEYWERTVCYGKDAVLLERRERLKLAQRAAGFFASQFLDCLGDAFKGSIPAHPVMLEAK